MRKYEQAIEELAATEKLLTDADPPYSRQLVYANWAKSLAMLNRFPEAQQKYDLALAINADSPQMLRGAAEVDLRLGDPQRALQHLRRAAQIDPQSMETALLLGRAALEGGDLTAAAVRFEDILRRVPNHPDATLRLAEVLTRMGRTDEAITRLTAVLSALEKIDHPNAKIANSAILTRLADLAAGKGQYEQAVGQYNLALAAWPDNYLANNNFAWLLATQADESRRDGKRAVQLARHACELLDQPNHSALGTLAAAYAANGQFPEAEKTAQQALELARKLDDLGAISALELQWKAYQGGQPFIAH